MLKNGMFYLRKRFIISLINTRINLDFLEIYLKNKPAFLLRNKNIGELIIG